MWEQYSVDLYSQLFHCLIQHRDYWGSDNLEGKDVEPVFKKYCIRAVFQQSENIPQLSVRRMKQTSYYCSGFKFSIQFLEFYPCHSINRRETDIEANTEIISCSKRPMEIERAVFCMFTVTTSRGWKDCGKKRKWD